MFFSNTKVAEGSNRIILSVSTTGYRYSLNRLAEGVSGEKALRTAKVKTPEDLRSRHHFSGQPW
jgi:hypothetical protein